MVWWHACLCSWLTASWRGLAGEMLFRHGGSNEGLADGGMATKLSSLNLPSSMDIARYLEQVQFVDLPEASPRKPGCVFPFRFCQISKGARPFGLVHVM